MVMGFFIIRLCVGIQYLEELNIRLDADGGGDVPWFWPLWCIWSHVIGATTLASVFGDFLELEIEISGRAAGPIRFGCIENHHLRRRLPKWWHLVTGFY